MAVDLMGPLVWRLIRRFNNEQGRTLPRSWRVEARHVLLYVSQSAAELRTALGREAFTDVQLAVDLEELIHDLTGLRNLVRPDSREEVEDHDSSGEAPAGSALGERPGK
jgi:hypothetical protein